MQVAALALAGHSVPVDADRVAAVYADLPRTRMPRTPVLTIAAAFAGLAVVGAVVALVLMWPHGKSHSYVRPLPPPSADAFAKGGVPLHDPALDALLDKKLTQLVIDAGAATEARHDELA